MSSYSPNPTAAAQPAVTVRRTRRRIGILALLAIGTMINYLDRTVLGIAAPKLTGELGIVFFVYDDADPVHMPVETVEIAVCEKCIAELQQ